MRQSFAQSLLSIGAAAIFRTSFAARDPSVMMALRMKKSPRYEEAFDALGTAEEIAMLTIWASALVRRFLREERGATAIEYGLIAGLIAVVIIAGLTLVGPELSTLFTTVATEVAKVN